VEKQMSEPNNDVDASSRDESPRDDVVSAATPEDGRVQQLERDLEAARKRIDELARAYQATQADSERFKERLTRERERMIDVDRGNAALLVIEAIDQLDLCLTAATPGPLTDGVKLVRDGLVKKLNDQGVERLELKGLPYDPNLAEAADTELVMSETEDGQVTQVTRAGYVLKERVIRPAQVRVGRYIKPAQA
jgi:molecular chaperone GrpE